MSGLDCSKGNCVSCHLVAVLLNIDKKTNKKRIVLTCTFIHEKQQRTTHTHTVYVQLQKNTRLQLHASKQLHWQPNVPQVAWVCAEKPIYSSLPVLCNRKGTKSMGHTSHIKLVLWMLTAIRVLGYRDVCVRVCAPVCISISGCTFQCVCVSESEGWNDAIMNFRQAAVCCMPATRPLVPTLLVHVTAV